LGSGVAQANPRSAHSAEPKALPADGAADPAEGADLLRAKSNELSGQQSNGDTHGRHSDDVMSAAKIAFYVVMFGLLGLGAYRGVLPHKFGFVRRSEDPKYFYLGLAFYAAVIAALPRIVR
jgi:hypothetical protein